MLSRLAEEVEKEKEERKNGQKVGFHRSGHSLMSLDEFEARRTDGYAGKETKGDQKMVVVQEDDEISTGKAKRNDVSDNMTMDNDAGERHGSSIGSNRPSSAEMTSPESIVLNHEAFIALSKERLKNLKQVRKHWTNGDVAGVVELIRDLRDIALAGNVLSTVKSFLLGNPRMINLEMWSELLPVLNVLLEVRVDSMVLTSITYLYFLTQHWARIQKQTGPPLVTSRSKLPRISSVSPQRSTSSRPNSRSGGSPGSGSPRASSQSQDSTWMPIYLICYVCGRKYGTKSLGIHLPRCRKLFKQREKLKPANERKKTPKQPKHWRLPTDEDTPEAIEVLNNLAQLAFEKVALYRCKHCNRTFFEESYKVHIRGCREGHSYKRVGMHKQAVVC